MTAERLVDVWAADVARRARHHAAVIAAAHKLAAARARGVVRAFVRSSPLWCLGVTKDGHPRHPLYVKTDAPLILWRTT